jgi:DNA-binding transcriptional regulator YhcF (GntR family)
MNLSIRREGNVPYHLQLEEQIKQLVWNGQLTPGTRLPSVRELAGYLRINRNTVARAYEGLERQGFVLSNGAKGTFVCETPPQPTTQVDKLQNFLKETFARLNDLGLNPEDFAVQLLAYAQSQQKNGHVRRILLLECNNPQLEQFRGELETSLPVTVETMLLDDLSKLGVDTLNLLNYDAVVTTFFHADEVRAMFRGKPVELVILLLSDNLPALLKLKRLPKATPVALVCESEHGLQNFQRSLYEAGLDKLKIHGVLVDDEPKLHLALAESKVVICSSVVVCQKIEAKIANGVEIITDDRSLDKQGIELLRKRLLG